MPYDLIQKNCRLKDMIKFKLDHTRYTTYLFLLDLLSMCRNDRKRLIADSTAFMLALDNGVKGTISTSTRSLFNVRCQVPSIFPSITSMRLKTMLALGLSSFLLVNALRSL